MGENKEESYIIAYSQVSCLIKELPSSYVERIPAKLIDLINNNSVEKYKIVIDKTKKINEQGFSDKARDLVALLKYNYWSTDEEKARLKEIFDNNEKKKEELLEQKYSTDNLFKDKKTKRVADQQANSTDVVEYKESIFTRLWKSIKGMFQKN